MGDISEDQIMEQLEEVVDPEFDINIVDLGLIYEVTVEGNKVDILMTLTTRGCPFHGIFRDIINEELNKLDGVEEIDIELTFDPHWDPEMMSDEARREFGNIPGRSAF
ncbi:metal-sulfur cluster assembly factor [Candidatus Nanohalobium constans]|uniref:FeS assembly SUF system protein n=1 Tax=Candidatus Nanohalobium constans TaxID=2565781 RepID=A0A5Q0UEZ0_9ARCH|nr:iron-sulfur cluster assembly protein [Candidatus Nanohalobium constans]QGA80163.1 FeS assembly SUF system protein [Candidatus Nanohalobium constans]